MRVAAALTGADGVSAPRRCAVGLYDLQNEGILLVRVGFTLVRCIRVRGANVLLCASSKGLRPQWRRGPQPTYTPPYPKMDEHIRLVITGSQWKINVISCKIC